MFCSVLFCSVFPSLPPQSPAPWSPVPPPVDHSLSYGGDGGATVCPMAEMGGTVCPMAEMGGHGLSYGGDEGGPGGGSHDLAPHWLLFLPPGLHHKACVLGSFCSFPRAFGRLVEKGPARSCRLPEFLQPQGLALGLRQPSAITSCVVLSLF